MTPDLIERLDRADLLRAMSAQEDALAKLIAERALAVTHEGEKRFLRTLWRVSNARAGFFMEMAHGCD